MLKYLLQVTRNEHIPLSIEMINIENGTRHTRHTRSFTENITFPVISVHFCEGRK